MSEKNKQFIAYITSQYSCPTITSIMKLAYLIDLISVKRNKKQISSFTYKRHLYGPFDQRIYSYIDKLIEEGVLIPLLEYSKDGKEYIIYKYNEDAENISFDKLKEKEKELIDEVLEELQGLGPRVLTEIAYKTSPMKKIGAKIGNNKGIDQILDLSS